MLLTDSNRVEKSKRTAVGGYFRKGRGVVATSKGNYRKAERTSLD